MTWGGQNVLGLLHIVWHKVSRYTMSKCPCSFLIVSIHNKPTVNWYVSSSESWKNPDHQYRKCTVLSCINDETTRSRQQADEQKTNTAKLVFRIRIAVVCCLLYRANSRKLWIQEHHRLISQSETFCNNMEAEILRKVQQYYGRWREMAPGDYWQATKRRFRHVNNIFFISCLI